MADVSHELGALRFVVDSPLSSKVAMFNNHVQQHKNAQHLNPFSGADGRASPKPQFGKDDYGKPLAGSLTEMRGQKANMHVMREMLELCQIINTEGYTVKDEPKMRVIPFGELFNIYNYISDKCVGILLRARKHKLVEFEGEMLFQRRDDDVPIFLLRPIADIKQELNEKIDAIKRASSPAPAQSTSVLMDQSAHKQKLLNAGLISEPKARSLSPLPAKAKAEVQVAPPAAEAPASVEVRRPSVIQAEALAAALAKIQAAEAAKEAGESSEETKIKTIPEDKEGEAKSNNNAAADNKGERIQNPQKEEEVSATSAATSPAKEELNVATPAASGDNTNSSATDSPADINNNATTDSGSSPSVSSPPTDPLPTIVVEASAVYVRNSGEESSAAATPQQDA